MRPARTATASARGRLGSSVSICALARIRSAGAGMGTAASVGRGERLRLLELHRLAAAFHAAVAGLGAQHFGAALRTLEALAKLVRHRTSPGLAAPPPARRAVASAGRSSRAALRPPA